MMFKYFKAPFTPDALKQQFKDQSKKLHPDMPGGDKEKFQEMQNEFDRVLKFAEKAKKVVRGQRRQSRRGVMFSFTQDEKDFIKELRDLASIALRNKIIEEVKKWNT